MNESGGTEEVVQPRVALHGEQDNKATSSKHYGSRSQLIRPSKIICHFLRSMLDCSVRLPTVDC